MARLFEIVPTTALTRGGDGSIEHDDRVMYTIREDAEEALDAILEPYGGSSAFYLDNMQVRSPGPWAYVALSREYDIANFVIAQRDKIGGQNSFKFTIYDRRALGTADFLPKVACFLFFSKHAVALAAERIQFLQPAWLLLRNMPPEKHWLVLLEEDPASVLGEGATA